MKRLVITAAVLALAVTACSAATSHTEPTPTVAPTTSSPTPTPTATPKECATQPFTGLPITTPVPNTVVGVKVENSPQARPQSGLESADIVFVEMVEGGETRYLALFNSSMPEAVGPVRSIRPTDAAVLGQWAGDVSLFYSGGIPAFETQVADAGVELFAEGVAGFHRVSSRRMPHNLYVSLPEGIADIASPEACATGLFAYRVEGSAAALGTPVTSVEVTYPSVRSAWTWNAGTGLWERSDAGDASLSDTTGNVLTTVNVVVMRVATRDLPETDVAGAPVPETILEGEGALDYFIDGQHLTGSWSKAGVNDPFVFTDANGAPMLLKPGNTWVELLPNQGDLTVN